MVIQIESEIIKGMAGEVKYCIKPCPHKTIGIGNIPAMVAEKAGIWDDIMKQPSKFE